MPALAAIRDAQVVIPDGASYRRDSASVLPPVRAHAWLARACEYGRRPVRRDRSVPAARRCTVGDD